MVHKVQEALANQLDILFRLAFGLETDKTLANNYMQHMQKYKQYAKYAKTERNMQKYSRI
jgi:hypothetical protein